MTLIKISEAFKMYDKAGWIVVSYMLTCTSFHIVYAKRSDILAKKNMMLLGLFHPIWGFTDDRAVTLQNT